MKNKVAGYLKVLSIVLFALSVFGNLFAAQKEETTLEKNSYSSSYSDKYDYKTKTVFDGTLFLTTFISSTITCSVLYALGELIDVTVEANSRNENRSAASINKNTNEANKNKDNEQDVKEAGLKVEDVA